MPQGLAHRLADLDRRVIGRRYDRPVFQSLWHRGYFVGFLTGIALMFVNTLATTYLDLPWSYITFMAAMAVPLWVLYPKAAAARRAGLGQDQPDR